MEAGDIAGVELNLQYWCSCLLPIILSALWGIQFYEDFFFPLCWGKNTSVKVFFFFFFKSGKKTAPEEDEAEETGDGVWRGHILCGCVLTVSDVGSSPTWSCKATEWRELSTGKNNYCGACAYCMLCETPLLQLVLSHFFSLGFFYAPEVWSKHKLT